jgi:hypothetical protein
MRDSRAKEAGGRKSGIGTGVSPIDSSDDDILMNWDLLMHKLL